MHGNTQEVQQKGLERIKQVGLTLNVDKCKSSKAHIKFLGQVIDETGASPRHAEAIAAKTDCNRDEMLSWNVK